MVSKLYTIREPGVHYDLNTLYDHYPGKFSIKLHHGGVFTDPPGRRYLNGKVTYVDAIDIDTFSVLEINDIMEELGYDGFSVMYYHFLRPYTILDYGLQALGSDLDVINLSQYVNRHKEISVYTEHSKTKALTYSNVSPSSKVVIQELESDMPSSSSKSVRAKKKLFLEWDNQDSQKSVIEQGEANVSDTQPIIVDQLTQASVVELLMPKYNVDSSTVYGDAFDNDFNPFFEPNEVSEPEDDRVEPEANGRVEPEAVNEDDSDNDYIVDEDNTMDDVEVDMSDFHFSVDKDVEFMGNASKSFTENVSNEANVVQLEVLNNEEFESGSESEDGVSGIRKKKLKELKKQQTQNRDITKTYFYVGQTFGTAEEVKEHVNLHAIETRRLLFFIKNDRERLRVGCEGKLPIFVNNEISGKASEVGQTSNTFTSVVGPTENQDVEGERVNEVVPVTNKKKRKTCKEG